MWKREEPVRPIGSPTDRPGDAGVSGGAPARQQTGRSGGGSPERDVVNIGKSVVIKGELTGSEDLMIEGQVEGQIELREYVLTIGPNGKINARVHAKSVVVMGVVNGNITATEKINIRENGSVEGDISAPRVAIAEGANFRGSIDMQRAQPSQAPTETKRSGRSVVAAATRVAH